jgi:type IV pilus assembly protein PilE
MVATLSPRQALRRRTGFTIIELMIVVAVASVLALVAYPSFIDSVRKGRRAEAVAALAQVQQSQERWRANNPTYTAAMANLKLDLKPGNKTSSGLYTVSIEEVGGSKYTATAQAVAGTSQSRDTNCTTMRVRLKDSRIEYGGCNGCALPADDAELSDPNRCWSR